MLMIYHRNLTIVYINQPMIKLVLLNINLLKVIGPMDDIKDSLYLNVIINIYLMIQITLDDRGKSVMKVLKNQ